MTYQIGNIGRYANVGSQLAKGTDYASPLASVGNAAGFLGGLQRRGGLGYGSAATNASSLANRLGLLGQYSKSVGNYTDMLGSGLGIASGIKQGGVSGYGQAGINAAKLGSQTGALPASWGQYAGYAAIPLSLYNEVKNWQSGNTGGDALGGAATGAAIGSVVPGIGTAIGALVGGAAGALSSVFGNGKVAPENANWVGYTDAYNKAGQQAKAAGVDPNIAQQGLATQVQNPYGALAGYFDLRNNQVKGNNPLYAQYGRMGEQKFTNDLVQQINDATKAGKIGPDDDASSIYSKVVQPWEDSWGRGASTDQNAGAMKGLLTQMISQYEGGQAGDSWLARSGDKPFANIGKPPTPNVYPPQVQGSLDQMAAAHDAQRMGMGVSPAATQTSPQPTNTAQPQMGIGAPQLQLRQMGMGRKKGGAIKRYFDEGGDVGGSDYEYGGFNPSGVIDFNSLYNGGSGNDVQDWNSNLSDIQAGLDQNAQFGNNLNTWLDAYEAGNQPKASGWDTLKKNATGGAGLSGLLKAYAPLLPLIQGAVQSHSNKAPTLPGGLTNAAITSMPQGHLARTQNMTPSNTPGGAPMSQQDWYTYGSRPEASFYNNNAVPLNQTVRGQAKGGKTPGHSANPGNLGQATGVPEFNSAEMNYVPDQGPGDGQSDDVDAKLSKGEYVFDAHTVSMLGNGSNTAGAQKLDQLRENLRKHAAKSNGKGKQFMNAKSPEHYMSQGKSKVKGKGKPVAMGED